MKKTTLGFFILILLVLLINLVGCGGGSGHGGPSGGTNGVTNVTGTVLISNNTTGIMSLKSIKSLGTSSEVPLAGATITIYKINSNGSLTAYGTVTATTDENGKYTLSGLPDPESGDKFVIRATKTVNDKTITFEVLTTELKAGQMLTQDVDPVLDFSKRLADALLTSVKAFWWDIPANGIKSFTDVIETVVPNYISGDGSYAGSPHPLPDYTDMTAVTNFYNGITDLINNDTQILNAFADVMVPLTPLSPKLGTDYVTVEDDPEGDNNNGNTVTIGDFIKVRMNKEGNMLGIWMTFNSQIHLADSSSTASNPVVLDIELFTDLRKFYTHSFPRGHEIRIHCYSDEVATFETDQNDKFVGNAIVGNGQTDLFTFVDLSHLPSGTTELVFWAIISQGDFLKPIRVQL